MVAHASHLESGSWEVESRMVVVAASCILLLQDGLSLSWCYTKFVRCVVLSSCVVVRAEVDGDEGGVVVGGRRDA